MVFRRVWRDYLFVPTHDRSVRYNGDKMNSQHTTDVTTITNQIKDHYVLHRPFRVYHGSTNATRVLAFKKSEMVDVSMLTRVLSVNKGKRTAIVEPNVPMDALVRETLKYGLVPPVVMEFPGITVGGGIQGGAGESSSFKWGCFNRIFNWYEMILANGEVVTVSPKKNADLFYGTAGSYGSLGVITTAEIQLVKATRYVEVSYIPVDGFDDVIKTISTRVQEGDYDFIDGIMFSKTNGVVIAGKLTDKLTSRVQRFTRAHDPWFYLHAEKISNNATEVIESVPLTDYLFRYDRGGFWVGKHAFDMFGVAFTPFKRWLLDPMLHTRKLYQALQESGASQTHVVQDMAVPQAKAVEFMNYVDESIGTYPLWICPMKPDKDSPLQANSIASSLVINIGIWGTEIKPYERFIEVSRALEKKLRSLKGKKWFYAQSYYTEKEFWSVYDKRTYDALRTKYHAQTLPDVYEKTKVKAVYDVNFKRGLYRTLFGRAKLRIEDE